MSNGYRNGAFALGLITGIGLALNLFLWLDYKAQRQSDQPAYANNDGDSSQIGEFWDWLIGTFISPSDTLAQWIMAAFTIGAVVLVWRTLAVTRKTLLTTQDMAGDAREIGEAQVRSYLFCKSARYERGESDFSVFVEIGNTGQSPAASVQLNGVMTIQDVGGFPEWSRVLSWTQVEAASDWLPPIISGGSASGQLWFSRDSISYEDFDLEGTLAKSTFDDGNEISVSIVVSWEDVFGQGHEFRAELDAAIAPSPNNPDMKREDSGGLDLRMDDTRYRVQKAAT